MNKIETGMNTWNRLTDLRGDAGGLEEISQRTYMNICIVHGHRQQYGEGGWGGTEWRGVKGGKWGTSIIVSTIKKRHSERKQRKNKTSNNCEILEAT